MDKMVKIYHYTNYDGKVAIEKDGYLKMSDEKADDALYGAGVYLTSMGPEAATEHIIMNNWGMNPEKNPVRDKHFVIPAIVANTEWYFEFESTRLPSVEQHFYPQIFSELQLIFVRDIWVYPNRNLMLGLAKGQRRETLGYGIRVECGILENLSSSEIAAKKLYLAKPQRFIFRLDNTPSTSTSSPPPLPPLPPRRPRLRMSNGLVLNGMTARIPMSAIKNPKPMKNQSPQQLQRGTTAGIPMSKITNPQPASPQQPQKIQDTVPANKNTAQGVDGGIVSKNKKNDNLTTDEKTSVVFHSFLAAKKSEEATEVKNRKRAWGRIKKLFRLSPKKDDSGDELDTSDPQKVKVKSKKAKAMAKGGTLNSDRNKSFDAEEKASTEEVFEDFEDEEENLCFLCFINLFCL